MRTQYCRDHIDAVAEGCGLDDGTVNLVKQATSFVDEYPKICNSPTSAIIALIRIPDVEVKALTISHIENVLKEETPRGGKKYPYITENQIKAFRARFELQVSAARQKEATRLRKEAEKKYAEVKEIADAEEKKRENAESLGVVLKITDSELEKTKESVMEELNRLKGLLDDQTARREEQEEILDGAEIRYSAAVERVNKCKEGLREAERIAKDAAGYRLSVIKEIQIIDKNSRITSEKIAEQAKLLV